MKNVTIEFDCNAFNVHTICKYEKSEVQADFDGSDSAPELTMNTVALTPEAGSSSLCGQHGGWTGTYRMVTPGSLWFT